MNGDSHRGNIDHSIRLIINNGQHIVFVGCRHPARDLGREDVARAQLGTAGRKQDMSIQKIRPTFTFDEDRLAELRAVVPEAFADGKINWDVLSLLEQIAAPPDGWDRADWVLSKFAKDEKEEIEQAVCRAATD